MEKLRSSDYGERTLTTALAYLFNIKHCFMKNFFLLALFLVASCKSNNSKTPTYPNLSDLVNPFIGTGGHGHTYPGATLPFGMMQLSPDTRLSGWDGCSGYHYSDSII